MLAAKDVYMPKPFFLTAANAPDTLHAVFEENAETAWLYLCITPTSPEKAPEIVGDVFVCNTVALIDHTELERYKPNLPPITKNFGNIEAVVPNIHESSWELIWYGKETVVLTRDGKAWALINVEERRGMCKAIKKSGPWGNAWHEQKYKRLLRLAE